VGVSGCFQLIGKEVDRGTSEDAYVLNGDKLTRYQIGETSPFPKVLEKLSDREIARRTGLDAQTISRFRKKRATVQQETKVKILKFARQAEAATANYRRK